MEAPGVVSVGEVAEAKPGLPRYLPQLDGIRGIAVFAVIAQHYWPPAGHLRVGLIGVYVFFVLSGFLITRILLGCLDDIEAGHLERGRSIRQFYIRRFLRIFPVYYLYLLCALAINVGNIRAYWGWFAAYLGNYYMVATHITVWPFNHFWTLALEEQFYLLWPWIVMWCPRRHFVKICVTAIIVGTCSKVLFYAITGNPLTAGMLLPDCLDTLACGALLAIMCERPHGPATARRWLRFAPLPGLALVVAGTFVPLRVNPVLFLSAGVCLAGSWLVIRAATVRTGGLARVLLWPPLRYVGTISYGVYVWHMVMPVPLDSIIRHLHLHRPGQNLYFLLIVIMSIAVASVSWWAFERPLNQLKRFFPYRHVERRLEPAAS